MFQIKTISGDYSEILLNDIEKHIGSLKEFRFSDKKQIKKIIKMNYKNVNDETLYKTIYKIILFNLDDKFYSYKNKDKKIDICDLADVKVEYKNMFEFFKIKIQ